MHQSCSAHGSIESRIAVEIRLVSQHQGSHEDRSVVRKELLRII